MSQILMVASTPMYWEWTRLQNHVFLTGLNYTQMTVCWPFPPPGSMGLLNLAGPVSWVEKVTDLIWWNQVHKMQGLHLKGLSCLWPSHRCGLLPQTPLLPTATAHLLTRPRVSGAHHCRMLVERPGFSGFSRNKISAHYVYDFREEFGIGFLRI